MRVLVACEFSGTVREAFAARGHDAWSCDLLPTEQPGQHIQGDVIEVLSDGWDLMVAHPPCQYLAVSGIHWNNRIEGRREKSELAIEFVRQLLDAPIPMIALENPSGIISTHIRKPAQFIQPWQFGHPYSKMTGLWLTNLPLLQPTEVLEPPAYQENGKPRWLNQTPTGQNKLGPSPDRWKKRSLTYPGIAEAMAIQWGGKE
jgi:site-specific DNA-cytosine methylase